jgi:SAM-dependent methyltransferase
MTTTTDINELKHVHRTTWAAGDYAAVADEITEPVAARLVARMGVAAGQTVLDVATGTGNVALHAAVAGASTTGLDLTPELLDTARSRARDLDLGVEWVAGDAEELAFADESFDRDFSAFGVQFAPRHQQVADELVRVCKPGGAIVLANWTPEGQVGDLFRIMSRYLPAPPAYASPPALWGDDTHVRELFGGHDLELELERLTTPLRYDSADDYVGFMETYYGPTLKARERLTSEGRWAECRGELVAMMERRNEATDGRLLVAAEYLLAVVRRS